MNEKVHWNMSVIVIAVATDSGVPIFSRKRGVHENVQFSTIASLHGVNMFSKCHNISMLETHVDNGNIIWKENCKSITLIGIATGGLECDLKNLLMLVYDVMLLFVGQHELELLKNVEQTKRALRQCYPLIDYLLESLDPNVVSSKQPTLLLDLIESILCPQAQQLQQALDTFSLSVSGRWSCLSIQGRLAACSSDFSELDAREARLLCLLLAGQEGAPLKETPVYLPQTSPTVAFRAITCKLLSDVYILVVCGVTPALSAIDEIVLQCWEGYAHIIKEAMLVCPRNFPSSVVFEPCILGVLLINTTCKRCVFSRHLQPTNQKSRGMSASHRLDILRTFYVRSARDMAPELNDNDNAIKSCLPNMCETYWSSEYHKCHGQKLENLLCCVLYASNVPTYTMRLITTQLLNSFKNNKEIYW